jgi:hypothetical protein
MVSVPGLLQGYFVAGIDGIVWLYGCMTICLRIENC